MHTTRFNIIVFGIKKKFHLILHTEKNQNKTHQDILGPISDDLA